MNSDAVAQDTGILGFILSKAAADSEPIAVTGTVLPKMEPEPPAMETQPVTTTPGPDKIAALTAAFIGAR